MDLDLEVTVWENRRQADRYLRRVVIDTRHDLGLRPVTVPGLPARTRAEARWRLHREWQVQTAAITRTARIIGEAVHTAGARLQRALTDVSAALGAASIPASASTRQEDLGDRSTH